MKVREKLLEWEEDFFSSNPFHFCPEPWDLPLPSYRLLPLSLAFHIFSFLPARISSAGHQHSFSTGSLCLDIPTPPSVLCSPAPDQENQLFQLATGVSIPSLFFFLHLTILSIILKRINWIQKKFYKPVGCWSKFLVNLNCQMSPTNSWKRSSQQSCRPAQFRLKVGGALAVTLIWSQFCSADYLLWGFVLG